MWRSILRTLYRAIFSNSGGTAVTDAAMLYVL
jgi:hypothetical protein